MSDYRVRVATTRTIASGSEGTVGGAAVHVLKTAHRFNGEEEEALAGKDWRIMFVELPQHYTDVTHPYLVRKSFPKAIPWVDLACGDVHPPRFVPSLVAVRGTVTRFHIDPPTGEEEVDMTIEILPAHTNLLDLVKSGEIADKLYAACLRAVNLFPRGRVELGSSFTAYLSMGYQRVRTSVDAQKKLSLIKIVWDLQVAGPSMDSRAGLVGFMRRTWRHMSNQRSVWAPSVPESDLFSPVEASMVMDLHSALYQLWHASFSKSNGLTDQLHAQASEVVHLHEVRPAYGKSTLRPWTGPQLFKKI